MVRLPSLVHVVRSAQETAYRFPWTLLSSLISAGISWLLVSESQRWKPHELLLSRLLLPAMLGISLFFALALWLEGSRIAGRKHIVGLALGLAILLVFTLSFSADSPQIYIYRFVQLAVASHLLVAVAPFLRRGNVAPFWEFNRILFQRILLSFLFSTILYAGLAIALFAVQSLLGVKVHWKAYYFLYLSVSFLFNTWFFLAGVPSEQELEVEYEYPAGLKMFVQFILLPLVTLYVVILYGYLVKILIVREWPRGTIGWLVSIVSVFGMLALLLVHPLRNLPGHRWIQFYSRVFYAGLFPLIILLLMAIWRRLSEYGLTEDRYFLLVLTLWMTAMAVCFSFGRQPSIKIIPISLALVATLTLGGAWGPYQLSLQNQLSRLRDRLERLKILLNGRIEKTTSPIDFNDRKEISGLVRYLVDIHGVASLQPWFNEDLKHRLEEKTGIQSSRGLFWHSTYGQPKVIAEMMGVTYMETWEHTADGKRFYAGSAPAWNEVRSISGYDYLCRFNLYKTQSGTSQSVITIGPSRYELLWRNDGHVIELTDGRRTLLTLEMKPFLARLQHQTAQGANSGLPTEVMSMEGESVTARVRLRFESVMGTRDQNGIQLESASGDALLKLKEVPSQP
jgi:MFS family permease